MRRNKTVVVCYVLLAGFAAIPGLLQTADTDGENGSRIEEAWEGSARGESPAGFEVTDVGVTAGVGVSLTWSDLGENFVYTVEFTDSLTEGNWTPVPPVDQWPTAEASWTALSMPGTDKRFYRIKTEALYDPPSPPSGVTASVSEEGVVIRWSPVPGASSYNIYWSTGEKVSKLDTKIEGVISPFTHIGLSFGVAYSYVVTAVGNKGESELSSVVSIIVAPALDRTVPTSMAAAVEFLYTGGSPVQTGVAPETIESRRVAVLRGRVLTQNGEPLGGVRITLLNHPEYGQTLTRADGMFDIAVNGGGLMTVRYEKGGYLPAQRQVDVPWRNYAWFPEVALVQLDSNVTEIDFSEPVQVARGNPMTDEDGTRTATLLFPQGTTAEMVFSDGSTQPLTSLSIRATEYTVGENGQEAMPAELPPTSAYTYCVEVSADEALAAGATDVRFDQPVMHYVENFLDFPVGSAVPTGYYDRQRGLWVPSENGRVIEILSETDGMADLDTDGDELVDDAATLAELGVNDAERQRLAELYEPGQSLWRVPITHFSPWDCNWPYVPPDDSEPPDEPEPEDEGEQQDDDDVGEEQGRDPCDEHSPIIECQYQNLRERVPVTGTEFFLHYRSNRVPAGRAYSKKIPLSKDTIPESLEGIHLEIEVAGRRFTERFDAEPGLSYTFEWDGKDVYGRVLQGKQPITIKLGYEYPVVYASVGRGFPGAFASFGGYGTVGDGGGAGGGVAVAGRTSAPVRATFWQPWEGYIGQWQATGQGLGGWTLDVHHAYDRDKGILYLGSGRQCSAEGIGWVITTVAGGGTLYTAPAPEHGDGGPATKAWLGGVADVGVGPDGSLYIIDYSYCRIRKVGPDGIITTIAGTGECGYSGDGGPAAEAQLMRPKAIALGSDGSVYVAAQGFDPSAGRVRRISPEGIISTFAGTGEACPYPFTNPCGDGGPATEAQLYAEDIAMAPDGSVLIADAYRIRCVRPDGIITTVAGTGEGYYWEWDSGDGGLAVEAKLCEAKKVAVGADGSFYILDGGPYGHDHRIRRVAPDGVITTVAGGAGYAAPVFSEGLLATECRLRADYAWGALEVGPDGSLYIAEGDYDMQRLWRVLPDGRITHVAGRQGGEGPGLWVEDVLARRALLKSPRGLALGHGGELYVAQDYGSGSRLVRRIGPPLSGLLLGEVLVPSNDGRQLYLFGAVGRHLRTLDAMTGDVLYFFRYDGRGMLREIEDRDGAITAIERDAHGDLTAIVAPFGQRTTFTLDANGYLASIANPAGEAPRFTYADKGLLTSFTDPKGATYRFAYDDLGRVASIQDPAGGRKTLTFTDTDEGYEVALRTAMGRTTTYRVEQLSPTESVIINSFPCCAQTETRIAADGTSTTTFPDGTVVAQEYAPDPRWGMMAPVMQRSTTTTPGGLQMVVEMSREVTLADPDDRMSLETYTEIFSINGRTCRRTYDAGLNQITTTSPERRESVTVLNEHGRVSEIRIPGLVPISFTYDSLGRLTTISQGSGEDARTTTIEYDAEGYIHSTTDPLSGITEFDYDAAGRRTRMTLPGPREVRYGYNATSYLTSVTPPGRPSHFLTRTALDLIDNYVPPSLRDEDATTRFAYNLDEQLELVTRPDGSEIDTIYDDAGRISRIIIPRGEIIMEYDATTGKLTTITAPDGGAITYGYDGVLLTEATWSGVVSGTVQCSYDDSFRVVSRSVNGAQTVSFQYDDDDLLKRAGAMTIARNYENVLIGGTTLGSVSTTRAYNDFGELEECRATFGGTDLYVCLYTRDKLGRITEKTETIGGTTDTYAYTYDLAGRLTEVSKNGTAVATYAYDANNNRLSHTGPDGSTTGDYDDQDRLLRYGTTTYTYTANGELQSKDEDGQTTLYDYDVLGNLISVTLPDDTRIEYVVDGQNRRIGKRVAGVLVEGFLYRNQLNPVAELDGSNNVVARFTYATRSNVPDYMERGGNAYRIISDHLGSPRLVVNSSTGEIAQQMDYDEFGNVILDTNPGFQPFGFAGGIYDTHTKLVRFGARDYDPETGRWTAKDPIRFSSRDTNLYVYVSQDPVNFLDPTGLNCEALRELVEYERRHGKWGTLMEYNLLNNDKLVPLNHNYESIYGPVDVDWMFRVSMMGLSGVPYFGGLWAEETYLAGKLFWNTARALVISEVYDLEYGSVFEEGNWNSWQVVHRWLSGDLTLEEIFRPALERCECDRTAY